MSIPSTTDGSFNKHYRKYRSECIIVNDMLRMIARHGKAGIKKTPLMNYMNMNNTSFKSYKAMLEDAALIERKNEGRNEVLVITGAGRLLLEILGASRCLYSYERWRARRLAESYARQLAEERGWQVTKDEGLVDYLVVGPQGVKVGVVGAVCDERYAALLARIVKLLTDLNNVVVVRLPGEQEVAGPSRLSKLSDGIVIVNVADNSGRKEVLQRLAELVAEGGVLEG